MKRDELLALFLRERQSFAQVFPFARVAAARLVIVESRCPNPPCAWRADIQRLVLCVPPKKTRRGHKLLLSRLALLVPLVPRGPRGTQRSVTCLCALSGHALVLGSRTGAALVPPCLPCASDSFFAPDQEVPRGWQTSNREAGLRAKGEGRRGFGLLP